MTNLPFLFRQIPASTEVPTSEIKQFDPRRTSSSLYRGSTTLGPIGKAKTLGQLLVSPATNALISPCIKFQALKIQVLSLIHKNNIPCIASGLIPTLRQVYKVLREVHYPSKSYKPLDPPFEEDQDQKVGFWIFQKPMLEFYPKLNLGV